MSPKNEKNLLDLYFIGQSWSILISNVDKSDLTCNT
jgi:hypothetical protein